MPHQVIPESQPTLAYLMTDVAGSTRLWEKNREEMARCVAQLDQICEETFERAKGQLLKSRGEGDSHFGVFGSVDDALTAATNLMLAISKEGSLSQISVRASVHAGSAETWAGDYYGPTINRCARIRQVAHPGQILVSQAVHILALPSRTFSFKDLGTHRLRDLMQPERLFQVVHPGLPSEFAPPETLSALSHNLPGQLTSFVGREQEIDYLADLIRSNRLTTVTGPGGVGKTRLTVQVAAESVEEFKDGAWFIDLAQTDRAESVLPIVCAVLQVGPDVSEQKLIEAIEHRQILLILDNCEHLFEPCRKLAANLLPICPNLSILATSRRVLEVRGEHVHKLGSLSLPSPEHLHEAFRYDGFRLFVERARDRGTGIEINEATIPGIVSLCASVDGLPLAIEIVASLTDVLSVKEISRSITECLDIPIAHGSGDPRQHTIASTIEWSCRLLSPEALTLLQQVAIFPSTWTLDTAHEVCMAGRSWVKARALVKELLDHSLVFSTHSTWGAVRFGLLQTTREVVSKPPREDADLFLPYIKSCRKTIDSFGTFMESGEEARAHESFELEWETLVKGLAISYETFPGECAAMALALGSFWMRGARMPEGKLWYEKLSTCNAIDRATRVSIQIALSSLYILLGENENALSTLLIAEETVRPIGGYHMARVIGNLAVHRDRMGKYQAAKAGFERCCILFKECGAIKEEIRSQLNLGAVKIRLEEPLSESAELFRQALAGAQAAGLTSAQANAYSCLAHVEFKQGKLLEALGFNRQALRLWLEDPNIPDCALAIIDLAIILSDLGRFESAAKAVHVAERLESVYQSPFPSVQSARLGEARETIKTHIPPADWRSGQRLTRSKTAQELITMAIQTVQDEGIR